MVADALFAKYGDSILGQKFKGAFTAASTGEKDFFCLSRKRFMNLSGESVGERCVFHKMAPKDVSCFMTISIFCGAGEDKQGGGYRRP